MKTVNDFEDLIRTSAREFYDMISYGAMPNGFKNMSRPDATVAMLRVFSDHLLTMSGGQSTGSLDVATVRNEAFEEAAQLINKKHLERGQIDPEFPNVEGSRRHAVWTLDECVSEIRSLKSSQQQVAKQNDKGEG